MKATRLMMGMPILVEVVDPWVTQEALDAVYTYFEYVDNKFSTYKSDSEISHLNQHKLELGQASQDMRLVFALAEETKQATEGYFDIARNGQHDPSGLVKGWAIYNAAAILHERGFQNFYVDAGGDIEAIGKNAQGQNWRVGIQNPFDTHQIVKVIAVSHAGVATSGTYVRGQHIYNPRSAAPLVTKVVSLTVIGPNIYEADRFATAAFAMGENGIAFIEELDGFEGYQINQYGLATYTSGFEKVYRAMIKRIDNWLNSITMYRLVEYYLAVLIGIAALFSVVGILPYDPFALLFSTGFLIAACWITNTLFSKVFGVPVNLESVYISALILALIVTPLKGYGDLVFLGWMAVWAMASKYIVAINGKHIFNPVAFAVALTAITINQTAAWWVGSAPMMPFVIVGGVLIVRKIRRADLVLSFFAASLVTILGFSLLEGGNLFTALQQVLLDSPWMFFAFVILTEPLTTPPTRLLQIAYGALVGFLFAPQFHIGSVYITPELAVLIGNVLSYLVSPKTKLALRLKEKIQLGPDLYDFIFVPRQRLAYAPGQYMEWTLGHDDPDNRGNRRYFTLASSPTENHLRLGVKFYPNSSSYKRSMLNMDGDSKIVAAQLAGDFTLPRNLRQKCVFIAGGIGITPFRSMIKFMLDTNQRRPVVLFYANRLSSEIVYKDVFDKAQEKLGIKAIYTLTDKRKVPAAWNGAIGHIDAKMIRREVPDFRTCLFYLSGPNSMVVSFEETLIGLGVRKAQIKKDFFPGFG